VSKYIYKVENFESEDPDDLEKLINKHAAKGWELHSVSRWASTLWIIFKGKK